MTRPRSGPGTVIWTSELALAAVAMAPTPQKNTAASATGYEVVLASTSSATPSTMPPPIRTRSRGLSSVATAFASSLALQQLGDLGQREAGVVAEPLDEAEPLYVRVVVEAVIALRSSRRSQ